MKRLKNILLRDDANTVTFHGIYDGNITFVSPDGAMWGDYSNVYYRNNVGFEYTATHKLAQDKPTVTVIIPREEFLKNTEDKRLKRLKYYLLQMEKDTGTYKEMYEGKVILPPGTVGNPGDFAEEQFDARYWNDDVSVEIEESNKLSKDKPTLTWNIPTSKLKIEDYTKAAADYCLRALAPYIDDLNADLYNRSRPDKENGKYYLHRPGGEIVQRNTAYFALCQQKDYRNGSGTVVYLLPDEEQKPAQMCLCIKMQVQLPMRKIKKTIQMLCKDLPDAVSRFIADFDVEGFAEAIELAEKQASIRNWLKNSDYCAFVANGSILPRAKGTDLPMANAIPFRSTPDDEIEICGVRGMGIKKGVTVITGGGYSGKSTLLDAISAGIYDHVRGDGRELCITDASAVSISAEDGRSVKHVNISPFIKWLPGGETEDFSTEHASGSTSQAANIMEAVDCGAKLLLIDEDRSATNFMIRDKMMKELIKKEPITPFTDRVGELYERFGTSTILVIGGSGEYLSAADRIYMMEDYGIQDVTERSKDICKQYGVETSKLESAVWEQSRILYSERFSSYPEGRGTEKLEVSDMGFIIIGDEMIDVRGLHDIFSREQLDSLGFMLRYLCISNKDHIIDIKKRIDELYEKIENEGLDVVYSAFFTTTERFLDLPRKAELLFIINRMRNITLEKKLE